MVGGVLLSRSAAASEPATSTAAQPHMHHPAGFTPAKSTLSITPFQSRMPVPPVAAPIRQTAAGDEYEIVMRPAQVEMVPGMTTEALTFGGAWVGPTIRGCAGRPVKVTFRNQLTTEHTATHLHGGHVKAVDDGYPMDMVVPGAAKTYNYPNNQRGATLWYHDHAHGDEAEHTYRGLHGFYLVDDPAELALGLPTGSYDVPVMFTDVKLDATGALIYDVPNERDVVLVNGKAKPYFPVTARKYRFRFLNGTNEGTYTLSIDRGKMWQIGSDGGLLPAPVARPAVTLSSGERADLIIDFTGLPVGSSVVVSDAVKGPVLRFDVRFTGADPSRMPNRLRALPALPAATVQREVHLKFDFTADPLALVNDKQFDPNRVDFTIKRGTTEIWTVYNDNGDYGIDHNFHLHMTQFRVLSRTGAPMTPDDAGLKDTVRVPPGTSVRLQATFADYLGRYVYHCHFLEHSSIGMMAQMEIVA